MWCQCWCRWVQHSCRVGHMLGPEAPPGGALRTMGTVWRWLLLPVLRSGGRAAGHCSPQPAANRVHAATMSWRPLDGGHHGMAARHGHRATLDSFVPRCRPSIVLKMQSFGPPIHRVFGWGLGVLFLPGVLHVQMALRWVQWNEPPLMRPDVDPGTRQEGAHTPHGGWASHAPSPIRLTLPPDPSQALNFHAPRPSSCQTQGTATGSPLRGSASWQHPATSPRNPH